MQLGGECMLGFHVAQLGFLEFRAERGRQTKAFCASEATEKNHTMKPNIMILIIGLL